MEKITHTGKVPGFDPQLHLFEKNKSDEDLIIEKFKLSPETKKHITKRDNVFYIYNTSIDIFETQLEERASIKNSHKITGTANDSMEKINGVWYLGSQTIDEYYQMMENIYNPENKDVNNPYAN